MTYVNDICAIEEVKVLGVLASAKGGITIMAQVTVVCQSFV